MLGMLTDSERPEKRAIVAEYMNTHEDQFEDLVEELFRGNISDSNHAKLQMLNLVDLLTDRIALLLIEHAIDDRDTNIRVRALQAAYRTRMDALNNHLVDILHDENSGFETRKWVLHILASTDPSAYRLTIRNVARSQSEDVGIRKEAIFALTVCADDTTLGSLCSFIGDSNVEIRRAGVWALARISSPQTVHCLFAALEDSDDDVRDWAIRGLRDMDDSRALQGLADAIVHAEPEEQTRLIRLVAEKRSETLLRVIAQSLNSPHVKVRREAAWAMGVSPYPPAADSLEALLNDVDEQVREYAGIALNRLGRLGVSESGRS